MRKVLFTLVLLPLLFVAICNVWIVAQTAGRIYDDPARMPANDVGLVLGTSKYFKKGTINAHFQNRIAAAAALYRAGKVKHLIASGDNSERWHDEPTDMKKALVLQGVPDSAITRDYAGFRTFDSIVRARKIFGQTRLTIISDRFHNYRALFLGDHFGIRGIALASQEVPLKNSYKTKWREIIARVKAVLDIYLLRTEPRVLGEPVRLNMKK